MNNVKSRPHKKNFLQKVSNMFDKKWIKLSFVAILIALILSCTVYITACFVKKDLINDMQTQKVQEDNIAIESGSTQKQLQKTESESDAKGSVQAQDRLNSQPSSQDVSSNKSSNSVNQNNSNGTPAKTDKTQAGTSESKDASPVSSDVKYQYCKLVQPTYSSYDNNGQRTLLYTIILLYKVTNSQYYAGYRWFNEQCHVISSSSGDTGWPGGTPSSIQEYTNCQDAHPTYKDENYYKNTTYSVSYCEYEVYP